MKKVRIKSKKAEVYQIENFLTPEECNQVIREINKNPKRSMVSGGEHKSGAGVSNYRTSSTGTLKHQKFPLIKDIDRRISRAINIPLELGEVTQGQKYEVGQEFKDHMDYFGKNAMKGHGDRWGNRTWTFMVYLNDDCEGGETEFKRLGLKFTPKTGMAVIWRNMNEDGTLNPNTMHAGRPVKQGVKYIITKWFRQKPVGAYPISDHFRRKYPNLVSQVAPATKRVSKIEGKTFSNPENFPKFTEVGFELRDVPEPTWKLIQDTYKMLQAFKRPEKFPGQMKIIYDKDKKESPVDILSLSHVKSIKDRIHRELQPILEEWSGARIRPIMMYGIRSYKKGAILADHVDRIKTHHISCIVIVDEKSNKPWPLDIQDNDGKWHKVYAKPGQMILYESLACMHGRTEEFDGEYFRNFFVHYKVPDWTYRPELMNSREKRSEVKRPNLHKKEVTV